MTPPCMVKVMEIFRVAPTPDLSDSPAGPKSLPLTFFDILWLRLPPVQRLYFYGISTSKTSFFNSIIPKLKHSLSLTLHHYLPLAGTLTWPQNSPKPSIDYSDGDGVLLTIAESDMDFYHLSSNDDFRQATDCHPLVPHLKVSHERAEVISLQVTLFPNSGFCIGITAHHAVLDGKTSTSFMKSWAQICRSLGGEEQLRPFYDRTVVKDPAGLETIYANEWLKENGPNNRSLMTWNINLSPGLVRGTFDLSRENIDKLKKSAMNKTINQGLIPLHMSTFSVTCSYTWVCVVKALGIREEKTHLGFNVDCRSRLKPAIPATYFGNCISGRGVVVEAENLWGEDGINFALEALSKGINSLDDGVLNGAENLASIIIGANAKRKVGDVSNSKVKGVSFAGSPRFEVYCTDFGWGKPRKVEMTSIDRTGAICLSDSRNGNGGVEIGLVLSVPEMECFASEFVKGLENL
ncbi:Agmatine coumaroyltransferase [Morus notabilis]|uniref:Agmatine coumaroyltransferase n=1 Tax=Morus notabilis TaxID=981085 RepID=W9QTK6_9ROSA|nr:phenolic glucoside malonyltransferase 1 [Morus notabilis]EXB38115.1 Agmatine coumaroyltransferase [Morus notabilis]